MKRAIIIVVCLLAFFATAKAKIVLYGTIVDVQPGQVVIATKSGKLIAIKTARAVSTSMSVSLYVGENVMVTAAGEIDGLISATAIMRAKGPELWPSE